MSEIKTRVSRDEFIARWNNYVGELSRLRWTLPRDQWAELDKTVEALREWVTLAADARDKEAA